MGLRRTHGDRAVSYTHLDVYKRQIDGSVKALEWIDCLDVGKGPGGLYIDVAVGESLQDGSHCFVYCHLLVYPYSAGAEFLFIGKA